MLLVISDLHIDPERPAITQAFFDFLKTTANGAEALYILGDLFEAWLGDDDDTPVFLEAIAHIKAYADQGHRVYFMHGNRDFLIGEQFAKMANVTLLNDPTVIEYHQQQYLLMHGDSLCTLDDEYMQFRTMVRNPEWQHTILSKSLEERREYARAVRAQSRSMTSLKAEDILDVTPSEVVKAMQAHKVQHFIHGHTHRPAVHELTVDQQSAKRYVLGDWGENAWYLKIDQEKVELHSYSLV